MSERVLVCILGQLRAHRLTWPSFSTCLLDELKADLAVCIDPAGGGDTDNEYLRRAKFRWPIPAPSEWSGEIDRIAAAIPGAGDWRRLRELCGNPYANFLGGVDDLPGSGAILLVKRWYLRHFLIAEGLDQRYDRFVITRSDFVYAAPHPPPAALDPRAIWLPEGEDWGGLVDRHIVVGNDDVIAALSPLGDLLCHPDDWAQALAARDPSCRNIEGVLRIHFRRAGLLPRVRRFPYIMYLVRGGDDPAGWTEGEFAPELGVYVKYPSELALANRSKEQFRTSADWLAWAAAQAKTPAANETTPSRGPRATLLVSALEAGSALERLKAEAVQPPVRADLDGTTVEAGSADNVLYIPSMHLQVWRDKLVPIEANADDDAFPELRQAAAVGEAAAHALFANIDEYEDDVCVLSNLYSHNFFHFIEELYKVAILERVGFAGKFAFSTFPSRLAPQLPRFASEFLELLGIAGERIIHLTRPTVLRSAWFTTRIAHADTPQYPGVFRALRSRLIGTVGDSPGLGARLWLDRRNDRAVVNAAEVEECLARHSFTVVDMAGLPVREQIAAAHRAEVLAGPHGAAMVHSMFMQEHSTVIECFSPEYVNPCVLEICRNLGHRHLPLVPAAGPGFEYRHGGAVEISLDHLELALRSLD